MRRATRRNAGRDFINFPLAGLDPAIHVLDCRSTTLGAHSADERLGLHHDQLI